VEQVSREEALSWDKVHGIYQRQCEKKKVISHSNKWGLILIKPQKY